MQYPIFDFPFYHSTRPIDIESIYPIGSIIFRSSPLADKVEWTDVSRDDPHFPVEWKGMTWELIVDPIPTSNFYLAYTQVHSIRNCRLRLTATEGQIRNRLFNGKMLIDEQDIGSFQLDTFTGENTHSHQLSRNGWADMSLHGSGYVRYNERWLNDLESYTATFRVNGNSGVYENFGDNWGCVLGGKTDNGSTKEYAYNLFMYKRIA